MKFFFLTKKYASLIIFLVIYLYLVPYNKSDDEIYSYSFYHYSLIGIAITNWVFLLTVHKKINNLRQLKKLFSVEPKERNQANKIILYSLHIITIAFSFYFHYLPDTFLYLVITFGIIDFIASKMSDFNDKDLFLLEEGFIIKGEFHKWEKIINTNFNAGNNELAIKIDTFPKKTIYFSLDKIDDFIKTSNKLKIMGKFKFPRPISEYLT